MRGTGGCLQHGPCQSLPRHDVIRHDLQVSAGERSDDERLKESSVLGSSVCKASGMCNVRHSLDVRLCLWTANRTVIGNWARTPTTGLTAT